MKKGILLILFLGLFAGNQALFGQTTQRISVSGKVTYQESPVRKVNIRVVGFDRGTETDVQGDYRVEARIGQTLKFSHVGFKDVEILLEDTSTVLNIALDDFVETLDEVVITAEAAAKQKEDLQVAMNVDLQLATGKFNPLRSAFTVHYMGGEELRRISSPSIEDLLNGRFSDVVKRPDGFLYIRKSRAKFDVDGFEYEIAPALVFKDIVSLYVVKGSSLVVIRTKNAPEQIAARRAKEAEKYKNQNFYNDDALSIDQIDQEENAQREVSGMVTFLEAAVADVNIKVLGTIRGTKTDSKGRYKITASPGETLQYSHVSFQEIEILVEDITSRIDLEMISIANKLDEVVITVTTPTGDQLTRRQKAERPFQTSRGNFDPKKVGYAIGVVDGKELSNTYSSLKEALKGKISGYSVGVNGRAYLRGGSSSATQDYPVAWEVDGVFTTDEPTYLDLTQIEAVYALKSLAATNKYGTLGAGGVIVIKTKFGGFDAAYVKKREDLAKLQNKNFYSDDAVQFDGDLQTTNANFKNLKSLNNKQEALKFYKGKRAELPDYSDHLSIAQLFAAYYKDTDIATQILKGVAKDHPGNPEIQKAIGYIYQVLGLSKIAVDQYKSVARLRPNYAQSYRDLANAQLENNQFVQAWRLYMSYILKGKEINGEGIGRMIYSEMEYMFYNRSNQAAIREKFVPVSEDIYEFRTDIRLVFEWNTSEAEFDIEFVNPERRAYVFEHSLAANQELIKQEKTKGFASKEFYIDSLKDGEWLVNFTYKGNKKPEPTYVKLTIYYNWGQAYQTQNTRVYKFTDQRQKLQLMKLSEQVLANSK